jgi:hypothetical protein
VLSTGLHCVGRGHSDVALNLFGEGSGFEAPLVATAKSNFPNQFKVSGCLSAELSITELLNCDLVVMRSTF